MPRPASYSVIRRNLARRPTPTCIGTAARHISLLCAALLLVAGVTSVFAYVIIDGSKDDSKQIVDTFTPGSVEMAVSSVRQDDGSYKFTIRNADNIDAYVRVALVFNWVDEDNGSVYYEAPDMSFEGAVNGDGSSYSWIKAVDGYFYYPAPVSANCDVGTTITVRNPVQSNGATAPEGYTFSVTAIAEGIQAKGKDANQVPAVQAVWKDNNGNGTSVVTAIGENGLLTIRTAS